MAYGLKYRFYCWSEHGVLHLVQLWQDGYSGSIIERPLGKSPVIRMQESGPFRSTSCNLTLECQEDGEFADLYTSNPLEFQVDVYRGGTLNSGGTLVWTGFVATEIYSEPDIAPPYDVNVTATDGLGVLKEYEFEERGLQKVREQLGFFLRKTGLTRPIYCLTSMGPTSNTPQDLFDNVSINMDYMVGENCYDVFSELLRSFHMTVTQYAGSWLLVRETDVASKVTSAGALNVYSLPSRSGSPSSTGTATVANAMKTVGQMGVADVWPVGYLTRRVVPAKKEVTIEAPWHKMNVTPSVKDDEWDPNGPVVHNPTPGYYTLGGKVNTVWTDGEIGTTLSFDTFQNDLAISVKYNRANGQWGVRPSAHRRIRLRVIWESGGTMYHYNIDDGWTETTALVYADSIDVDRMAANTGHDPALAISADFSIPAFGGTSSGYLTLVVCGLGVDVYDVNMEVALCKGYKDIISLSNGARGKDGTYTITGGRALYGYLEATAFYSGLFVWTNTPGTAVYAWSDNRRYGIDFMSLAALDYALSIAAHRVQLSGTIDLPDGLMYPPFVLSLRNVLHQMKTYDWTLKTDEVSFTAVSVPDATVTVESETVISIPND